MLGVSYRLGRALVALVAVVGAASAVATAGSASADELAVVNGGGHGMLTDPDGNTFPLKSFKVRGVVEEDGSARGRILFVWRGSFPEVWGDPVCEGTCDRIVLKGKIESGSVAADGTVRLSGTLREIDTRRGEVVFDSGFDEPFSVVVGGSQGKDRFILQWCLLPEFGMQGSMRVKIDGDSDDRHERTLRATASAQARHPCAG